MSEINCPGPGLACIMNPALCGCRSGPPSVPPFQGAASDGEIHSADPATGRIYSQIRSAGIAWPHGMALVGGPLTVPGSATLVIVRAVVGIDQLNVTLAGVGFAHGWASVQLTVTDGRSVFIRCIHEVANHYTWAGLSQQMFRDVPEPQVVLTGSFQRAVVDPMCQARFFATVQVNVDGTYFGFAGGITMCAATVRSITASGCSA